MIVSESISGKTWFDIENENGKTQKELGATYMLYYQETEE